MLEIRKYYPALHGAATDKLALLCGQKGETDIFTGKRTVTGEGLTLEPGQETFHVSTHKLLSSAVIVFTKDTANTAVAFTLREYAELLGIGSSRTGLDNLRRTVQRDLKILSELSLSWQETIGGKAESFKDIPTCKEQGFDVVYVTQRGMALPLGVDDAIRTRLQEACAAAIEDPDFVEFMKNNGQTISYMNAADYTAYLAQAAEEVPKAMVAVGLIEE